eukprot:3657569-Rhodomonas_salina.5
MKLEISQYRDTTVWYGRPRSSPYAKGGGIPLEKSYSAVFLPCSGEQIGERLRASKDLEALFMTFLSAREFIGY